MSISTEIREEEVGIDLSKLINFGVTFEPLQLTLRDILRRVAQLERQKAEQDERIAQLSASVDSLDEANKSLEEQVKELQTKREEEKGSGDDGAADGPSNDSDAIWDEIARLNGILGDLRDGAERDRHTIDEIYAARKRHQSIVAVANSGALPPASGQLRAEETAEPVAAPQRKPSVARPLVSHEESAPSRPVGEVILDRAREELAMEPTEAFVAFEGAQPADGESSTSVHSAARKASSSATAGQQQRPASVSISFASRPLSGGVATGGEDAGEHRGSVASVLVAPGRAQRRSMYADERIAAAVARRVSQFSVAGSAAMDGAPSASASVFEKLRRDGDDIAYLNRVVAEILGEMKSLHEDVHQLRTHQEVEEGEGSGQPAKAAEDAGNDGAEGPLASLEALEELQHRLARVEGEVTDAKAQLQHRDDGLQEELDELKRQLRVARGLTDDDVEALRGVRELAERVKAMEERLRVLEAGQGALAEQFASVLAVGEKDEDGPSEINALQFAALQGAVKSLEKQLADLLAAQGGQEDTAEQLRRLTEAVRQLEGEVETSRDQLQRAVKETARLEEAKANRSELPDAAMLQGLGKRHSNADANAMADIVSRLGRAEAGVERLTEDKADRSALHKLRDELKALRELMEAADGHRPPTGADDDARRAALEKALREVEKEVASLKAVWMDGGAGGGGSGGAAGAGGEEMEDLRDRIERLDHCKADATLVANKAERDYVENALERLMREVEQVLNATNAGLIDTLEKSLNILRDMIDGKATKEDMANLQGWMAESNTGAGGAAAADGLTGFKGFRCLGCNRPMDNMRPRTLPASMTPFLNRNPQNFPQDNVTRTIQQQQPQQPQLQRSGGGGGGGYASSFTVGGRGAGGHGSPDASLHRSTNSEPLPPIE